MNNNSSPPLSSTKIRTQLAAVFFGLTAVSTGVAVCLGVWFGQDAWLWVAAPLVFLVVCSLGYGAIHQILSPLAALTAKTYGELAAAQSTLRSNVQRDEALLASIGDGVIATDNQGIVVLMNKAAENLLRTTKDQAVGRPYRDVWNLETEKGEAVPYEQTPLYQALHAGQAVKDASHYATRRDAHGNALVRFPVAISVSPVVIEGRIYGSIDVFRDITHDKQIDRMKTEFISLASHQLRTPLSAIRWFAEMLVSGDAGDLTPEQAEFAQNIHGSTERMIDMVNALLNISRIESGRILIAPKPTDLRELVQSVVNDLKSKLDAKEQTIAVDVHANLPLVNVDPRLIRQVYLNFISNAIKYTPKGGEIAVFVSRQGDELVSQVTDNGYGIPKEQQGRVFQKFFRAENAVKIETDGSGLGLYLVRAVVESSGGKIWFESEEGTGTTFWFSLPMSGMKPKAGEVTLDG